MGNKHPIIVLTMWATIALNALLVITSSTELVLYSKRAPGTDVDFVNNIVTAVIAFATLFSGILYLRWQYSVVKIRRSQDDFSISPGWSVASWFIPIMALFKPYEIVKQIADSIPSAQTRYLKLWWGMWLVTNIASNLSFRISLLQLDIVQAVCWVVAGLLFIPIFKSISSADEQQSMIEQVFA